MCYMFPAQADAGLGIPQADFSIGKLARDWP
jgi:hypothetical protein